MNLLPPKTKKHVRSLLGLLSYYRSHVLKFAEIALPLIELTRNKAPSDINWTKKHDDSIRKFKKAICEAPDSIAPNFRAQFTIFTDTSTYQVVACLAQVEKKKRQ
ncbi:retrovirus-related Pol polyprotein from transposon opus [Nephila pilipes]|uniref:Retrovirus-related Pol polyprotein from transposon opus n=1 Tax=Nephila pilipes TaxID=299642 RepID=A0A8X6P024_NEPPI|nr:retrovirus-related Pol polyprotein from transposon opus [Nephila pilipes]